MKTRWYFLKVREDENDHLEYYLNNHYVYFLDKEGFLIYCNLPKDCDASSLVRAVLYEE